MRFLELSEKLLDFFASINEIYEYFYDLFKKFAYFFLFAYFFSYLVDNDDFWHHVFLRNFSTESTCSLVIFRQYLVFLWFLKEFLFFVLLFCFWPNLVLFREFLMKFALFYAVRYVLLVFVDIHIVFVQHRRFETDFDLKEKRYSTLKNAAIAPLRKYALHVTPWILTTIFFFKVSMDIN